MEWLKDNSYLRKRLDKTVEMERTEMLMKTGYFCFYIVEPALTTLSGWMSISSTTERPICQQLGSTTSGRNVSMTSWTTLKPTTILEAGTKTSTILKCRVIVPRDPSRLTSRLCERPFNIVSYCTGMWQAKWVLWMSVTIQFGGRCWR